MVPLCVTLEKVVFRVLKKVPVNEPAEGPVFPHNSHEAHFDVISDHLQAATEAVDGFAEGMVVREGYESECTCTVPHALPSGEVEMSGGEGGEILSDF